MIYILTVFFISKKFTIYLRKCILKYRIGFKTQCIVKSPKNTLQVVPAKIVSCDIGLNCRISQ